MKSDFFIFGDSHASILKKSWLEHYKTLPQAVQNRVKIFRVDGGDIVYTITLDINDGTVIANPILQKSMKEIGLYNPYTNQYAIKDKNIGLMFGFGEIHVLGFHPGWQGFGIYDTTSGQESSTCVSQHLLVEMLKLRYRRLFSLMKMLMAAGANVFLVAGPPPHKSNEFINEMQKKKLAWIPAPSIRLCLFKAMQTVAGDWAMEIGCGVLDFTDDFVDEDGYLSEEFYGDGVHANLSYGREILIRMTDTLERLESPPHDSNRWKAGVGQPSILVPTAGTVGVPFQVLTENIAAGTSIMAERTYKIGKISESGVSNIVFNVPGKRTVDVMVDSSWLSAGIEIGPVNLTIGGLGNDITEIHIENGLDLSSIVDTQWKSLEGIGITKDRFSNWLRSILNPQGQTSDRYLRMYQASIIKTGSFSVTSPFTGTNIAAIRSHLVSTKNVFYEFADKSVFYLISDNAGDGFALSVAWIPKIKTLIYLYGSSPVVRKSHILKFEEQNQANNRIGDFDLSSDFNYPSVLTGHNNYAHHIINDLSALNTLISGDALKFVKRILVSHEPIGPIDEIFPELKSSQIIREPISDTFTLPGQFFVNAGGFYIETAVRERLKCYIEKSISEAFFAKCKGMIANRYPIFWLSIRATNRTAVNLHECLSEIIKNINISFPSSCVLLDGFSFPCDFNSNPRYKESKAYIEKRYLDENDLAEKIINTCHKEGIEIPVHNCVGLPLNESIYLTYFVDFYFAHQGTIQHKIGWTSNKPGIIHSNSRFAKSQLALKWAMGTVEDSAKILYFPVDLVEDIEDIQEIPSYYQNYRILDLNKASAFFIESAINLIV